MKHIFHSIVIAAMLVILALATNAQTNVSGGIYANTTWTKVNSPYIVTSTVVVFPNDTLTIQPGVVVKFRNNQELDIRGKLIAMGTAIDSITFTSDSTVLKLGNWNEIYMEGDTSTFEYCNICYSAQGLYSNIKSNYKNCRFNYNSIAVMYGNGYYYSCSFDGNYICFNESNYVFLDHCKLINSQDCAMLDIVYCEIKNCVISSNQTGIESLNSCNIKNCNIDSNHIGLIVRGGIPYLDTVINCQIKYNGIGINVESSHDIVTLNDVEYDTIGIEVNFTDSSIYCNKFCNNISYDLANIVSNAVYIPNNYWCTPDSAATELVIYDGYDDASRGLVYFMPMDSICYLTTGIPEFISYTENNISIYPNPATDNLTIDISATLNIPATIEITNIQGQVIEQQTTNVETTNINVSALAKGMYFVKIKTEKGVALKKFIKE